MKPQSVRLEGQELLAHTLYLLSRSATLGVCRGRMRAVIQHLSAVSNAAELPDNVRAMCDRLLVDWRAAQAEHFGQDSPAVEAAASRLH